MAHGLMREYMPTSRLLPLLICHHFSLEASLAPALKTPPWIDLDKGIMTEFQGQDGTEDDKSYKGMSQCFSTYSDAHTQA
jgi:hypothetical protein